ncbi:class I SAM-dependent methyltransferase [bacterium]|jgi:ubiquinone/menaquinone biosynthesis C-methylase UbiE|nr:class I SAM-dependent methyltransferase [bacterium]
MSFFINILYFFIITVLVVVSICFAWRFLSQKFHLPCPSWLGWMVEMDNPFTKTSRASVIIGHLELKPGMKVLDVGCGPGRLTIPIAKKIGPQGIITALDVQQEMLQRVQQKAQAESLKNIQLFQANIEDGKIENNLYDRALLISVLGEIPNMAVAMKKVFDSLKPGGMLLVTEVVFDPHFQSQKTVLRLAKSAGFRVMKIVGNRFAFTMQLNKPID